VSDSAYVEGAIPTFAWCDWGKNGKSLVRMVRRWDRTHDLSNATPTFYHRELTMNEWEYLTILDIQYTIFVYSHLQSMICVHVW